MQNCNMQLHKWLADSNKSFDDGLKLLQEFNVSQVKIDTIIALKGTKLSINKMVEWLTPISINKPAVKQHYYSKNQTVKELDDTWRRKYKTANHIHQTVLKNENTSEQNLKEGALKILDIFENEIDPIWKDLKHFDENGILPEKHFLTPKKEISITDKMKRRNTLRTYLSKFSKSEDKKEQCNKWKQEMDLLTNEIENAI